MKTIDRHSMVPLYFQLAEALKDEISSGLKSDSLTTGDMIPSERALMKRYGVSRNTVRKAVDELVRDNIIYRGQGHGTYIVAASISIQSRIDIFCEHSLLLKKAGFQPSCRVVEHSIISADDSLCERLLLGNHEKILRIKKVFCADSKPAVLAVDYVPLMGHDSVVEDIEKSGDHFFQFLETHGLPPVEFILADILPVVADEYFSGLMGCPVNTPLILLHELMLDPSQKKPVLFAENYYLPDFVHFSIMRRRQD